MGPAAFVVKRQASCEKLATGSDWTQRQVWPAVLGRWAWSARVAAGHRREAEEVLLWSLSPLMQPLIRDESNLMGLSLDLGSPSNMEIPCPTRKCGVEGHCAIRVSS